MEFYTPAENQNKAVSIKMSLTDKIVIGSFMAVMANLSFMFVGGAIPAAIGVLMGSIIGRRAIKFLENRVKNKQIKKYTKAAFIFICIIIVTILVIITNNHRN